MMIIENKFDLGDIVYLKTDPDQKKRMVIQISIRVTGIIYEVNCADRSSWHYEMELSNSKDVLMTTTN